MLVVSLRGVNFGFWSRLRCSGQNVLIFSCQGLINCLQKRKNFDWLYLLNSYLFHVGVCISFGHAQIGLFIGFKFKISDEHPHPFHMGVPPWGVNGS